MGITDRKMRQKEEVRVNILDSAWEMVIAEGWQSLSIRKIADAIEYSVPVIYSHFENKDAILLEFNKKGFRLLVDQLEVAKAGQQDPAEQIRAMAKAYWDFAFKNRQYYQLMYGLGIPTCDVVKKIPAMADFNAVIMGSIQALLPEAKKQTTDAFLKFHSFWSMMHGLVSINMLGQTPGKSPVLAEDVLNDVVCGFIKGIVS